MEVTAEAAVLQTENANLETNFNKSQVDDLPDGGRRSHHAGHDRSRHSRQRHRRFQQHERQRHSRASTILYTLDGMDQNDPANNLNNSGASNNLLGANAVGEVAVVMNAYSPQYGRMAGAQVNMVGITGANQFHGNLFYNFNYEKLNANSFFNNCHQHAERPVRRAPVRRPHRRTDLEEQAVFLLRHENLRYVLPAAGVISLPSPQLQAYTLAHVPARPTSSCIRTTSTWSNGSPGLNRAVPVTNGAGQLQDGNGHLGCGTNTFYRHAHRNGRNLRRGHPLRGGLRHQQHRNQHRTAI